MILQGLIFWGKTVNMEPPHSIKGVLLIANKTGVI